MAKCRESRLLLAASRSKNRLLLESIEISLGLVAAELILEGVDALPPL